MFHEKYNDTIKRLKTIQKVEEIGDRINVNTYDVQKCGFLTTIRRTYSGESRKDTIKFIEVTIDSAFELIKKSIPDHKKKLLENGDSEDFCEKVCKIYEDDLISNLKKSLKGIKSLYNRTYHNDIETCCMLKNIMSSAKIRLESPG